LGLVAILKILLAYYKEMPYNFKTMNQSRLAEDVNCLKRNLSTFPDAVAHPTFVVVSGLPGTGKTFFCRKLAENCPFLIIESDAMRKALFASPNYSASESTQLFKVLHRMIEELLRNGISLVFDATNLIENHREYLYRIADRSGARLIIVHVEAPPEVVHQRLQIRQNGDEVFNRSDADRKVYDRMKLSREEIRRNHLVVDTSRDITPVIDKIVRMVKY
jgi:predicted kinase